MGIGGIGGVSGLDGTGTGARSIARGTIHVVLLHTRLYLIGRLNAL